MRGAWLAVFILCACSAPAARTLSVSFVRAPPPRCEDRDRLTPFPSWIGATPGRLRQLDVPKVFFTLPRHRTFIFTAVPDLSLLLSYTPADLDTTCSCDVALTVDEVQISAKVLTTPIAEQVTCRVAFKPGSRARLASAHIIRLEIAGVAYQLDDELVDLMRAATVSAP